jgi:hypothetical protein
VESAVRLTGIHECGHGQYSQGFVHLREGLLGLFEETEDDSLTEVAVIFTIVHFQDLIESHDVDSISKVGQTGVASIMLHRDNAYQYQSCREHPRIGCKLLTHVAACHAARIQAVQKENDALMVLGTVFHLKISASQSRGGGNCSASAAGALPGDSRKKLEEMETVIPASVLIDYFQRKRSG